VIRLAQVFCVLLVAFEFANPVLADEKQRQALAREVMTLTGMAEIGDQVSARLLTQLGPVFPTVPDELWVEIIQGISSEEIVQLSIPPYVKHFSEEELAAMVELYKSPLGKAILEKMPAVQYETMVVGNEWGQRKSTEIIEKLKSAGYEPQGM
jgi:hypothetical protein